MRVTFGELVVNDLSSFKVDYATFISSKYVVSLDVLEYAAKKAVENWEKGRRISKSPPIELLLYCAATRQIKDALKLGVVEGRNRVAAVILDESRMSEVEFTETDFRPEYDLRAVMDFYGITDEEITITGIEKLPLLLRERIALFSVFGERVK